ncbi:UPF0481 protein At3g47200-like [Juglans microcarpa x Juglans regia]|uniref:UPF0481 protein At3g47200-like n=1 Tax=Juglans microcarpa x Juglans regia TaxID=2249226 RepID=UPI001B7EE2B7|nr:UPF0481 protein At3g47200-like [Juglans microcarpa x Juglans regia]
MEDYLAIERIEGEAIDSITKGDRHRELVINIKEDLGDLELPLSTDCCIYRVPDPFRKMNEESFTPLVVSIGPFHHSKERLKIMEKFKTRCLERFLQHSNCNVEDLVDTIKSLEGNVGRCYAETIHLSSDEFVKLILLDACFVIEFFISESGMLWSPEDTVFLKPWLTDTIKVDLGLLENQLPFFVMDKLFNINASELGLLKVPSSFTRLSIDFFRRYNIQGSTPRDDLEIKHFVDLVRTLLLPSSKAQLVRDEDGIVRQLYSASQLNEAGVEFNVSYSKSLVDLQFTNGALEIPYLELDTNMESTLWNVTAFELCHYPDNARVGDDIVLMSFLLRTTKDEDLLIEKGILVNWVGENNAATGFFNNLCPHLLLTNMNTSYIRLAENLNAFYKAPWHAWTATFKRDYFSTPWRTFSTIAAVTFLVLTLIQTFIFIISQPLSLPEILRLSDDCSCEPIEEPADGAYIEPLKYWSMLSNACTAPMQCNGSHIDYSEPIDIINL